MFFKAVLIALPVFFVIDMIWLGLVAKSFYDKHIGHLLRKSVSWPPAVIFYVLFVFALAFFVIVPSIEKGLWYHAALHGAFFGFIAYATYDLTNLSTLKGWPVIVTIFDIAWGSFLGASVSTITYFIITNFFA